MTPKTKHKQPTNLSRARALFPFALLGIAFQLFWLGFLVIPAMALVFVLFRSWQADNFVRRIWQGGLVFMALVWSWLLVIEPSSWAPIQGQGAFLLVVFIWMLVVLITSLPLYFIARIWVRLNRIDKPSETLSLVYFAALWVLFEYGRSMIFALSMIGDGSAIAPHWNFGTLGIAMTSLPPLLPLAGTFGMYGMSLFAVFLSWAGLAFVESNRKLQWSFLSIMAGMLVVGVSMQKLYAPPTGQSIEVAAVNTSQAVLNYERFAQEVKPSDLVVLPEYSRLFEDFNDERYRVARESFAENSTRNDQSVIITSISEVGDDGVFNRLTHYSPNGSALLEQDKTFLIPGGEYLAYWFEPIFGAISPLSLQEYDATRKVFRGPEPEQPYQASFASVGSYACSGVISPSLYRSMAAQGSQILTNSASLAIFNESTVYHEQTKAFAIFHAAANQKPFVQATKHGKGLVIDSTGRILSETGIAEDAVLQHNLELSDAKTLFTRFGELGLYASALVIASALWDKSYWNSLVKKIKS